MLLFSRLLPSCSGLFLFVRCRRLIFSGLILRLLWRLLAWFWCFVINRFYKLFFFFRGFAARQFLSFLSTLWSFFLFVVTFGPFLFFITAFRRFVVFFIIFGRFRLFLIVFELLFIFLSVAAQFSMTILEKIEWKRNWLYYYYTSSIEPRETPITTN